MLVLPLKAIVAKGLGNSSRSAPIKSQFLTYRQIIMSKQKKGPSMKFGRDPFAFDLLFEHGFCIDSLLITL